VRRPSIPRRLADATLARLARCRSWACLRCLVIGLCLIAFAAGAAPGLASPGAWHAHHAWNLRAPVEGEPGTTATARLSRVLLPDAFHARTRGSIRADNGSCLAFGPVGRCASTGSIRVGLLHSQTPSATETLTEALPHVPDHPQRQGTRGDAAWRLVTLAPAVLRGAYARRAGPALPDVWVIVRIATTPHRRCPRGADHDALTAPLLDALSTIKASGY
jgi:hypothetical protein